MTATPYHYQDNLETERLKTRFLTMDDIQWWVHFFKDKEAIAFLPSFGSASLEDRAKNWIEKQLDRYAHNRYGLQVLMDKKTNDLVGQCGLLSQEVDGKSELEVGYHILKKYWGKGYAPEGARLFIDYAFKNNLATSVISIIANSNTNSQRVADKNGLTREKQTTWSDLDVYIYRIYKEKWQ